VDWGSLRVGGAGYREGGSLFGDKRGNNVQEERTHQRKTIDEEENSALIGKKSKLPPENKLTPLIEQFTANIK